MLFHFEGNAAYVAVGISRDGTMAESSVIECIPTAYSVTVNKSLASGRPDYASSREGINVSKLKMISF